MQLLKHYQFRPGLWPSVATLLVFPLLLSLGFWQLDRADQKAELQAAYDTRYASAPVDLALEPDRHAAEMLHWRPVALTGQYRSRIYLLDNQVRDQQPGYGVYQVMDLATTPDAVLVYRGWIAAGFDRSWVPEIEYPQTEQRLTGRILPPPATGLLLSEHEIEPVAAAVYRVQRLDPEELRGHSGASLLPYVAGLEAGAPGSYRIDARQPGAGRERHLGYAFQWFALAATLMVIYIVTNTSRRKD